MTTNNASNKNRDDSIENLARNYVLLREADEFDEAIRFITEMYEKYDSETVSEGVEQIERELKVGRYSA